MDSYSTIQYCYYPENEYPAVDDGTPFANVNSLSEAEMQKEESFRGFDFTTTWKMGSGNYPYPVIPSVLNPGYSY